MKHVVICLAFLLVIGEGLIFHSQALMPNYVKTDVYFSADSISTSVSYSDGLGKDLQTSLYLGPNSARVSSNIYDDLGRPWKSTSSFNDPSTDFIFDPLSAAQSNRGDDYPYNELRYKSNPFNRIDAIGAPGEVFSLNGTHFSRTWFFGTVRGNANSNIDGWGFLIETTAILNETKLDELEASGVTALTPTHFLTVTKGPNDDSYYQEIKDGFGRTIYRCSMLGIMSETKYDIVGNVLQETPPDSDNAISRQIESQKATVMQYTSIGQVIGKTTPDAGLVEFQYDAKGQLIASQNAKQRFNATDREYTVYLYDSLGRNVAIGINTTTTTFQGMNPETSTWTLNDMSLRIRKIFDDPAILPSVFGATFTPEYFALNYCALNNTQGRLIAEIAYRENIRYGSLWRKSVVDLYSYDEEGRIVAKLKRIPQMSNFCMFTFSYDLQGNLIAYRYAKNDQLTDPTMDNMQYRLDRHGRLLSTLSTNPQNQTNPLVDNSYNALGLVDRKVFGYSSDRSSYIDDILYSYNLRNWATGTANSKFMETNICYHTSTIPGNSLLQPQFNGNVSAIKYSYNVPGISEIGIDQYEYDKINRLINDYPTNAPLSARQAFGYNNDGTISLKARSNAPAGAPTFSGTYRYIPNTNKVHSIEGHASKGNTNNYIYDPNGNMIFDYSKKMYIEYDWRDMPVSFKFFNSIPTSVLSFANETARANLWINLKQNIEAAGASVVSEVRMVYDATGDRVSKKEYKTPTP